MANVTSGFWRTLEKTYNVKIPEHIKYLLEFMGYGNPISFQRITQTRIDEIENCARRMHYLPAKMCNDQLDCSDFLIVPGHKYLILGLAEMLNKNPDVFFII